MSARLSADGLIAEAISETGLDDFGGGPWRDGLNAVVEALDVDAALNDIGVATWTATLGSLLRSRLQVEETFRRHPEIGDETLPAPIWIVGIPRTGTTALSSLLAQDPSLRALRTWEAVEPCPPPETATQFDDPRIEAITERIDLMEQMEPDLTTMHDADPVGPTENHDLHGMAFRTQAFDGLARIPAYYEWWLSADLKPAFDYQRRTAKLLQWRCPPNRWHFKSPPDLFALDVIRMAFPDARFVWTHRDPAQAVPSIASFEAHLWRMGSDDIRFTDVGPHLLETWSEGTRRGMAARKALPDGVVFDLSFAEFRRDQMGVVARLYEWLGLDLSGEVVGRMRAWLDQHPQGRHGRHAYTLDDYGLTESSVRTGMEHYTERFADYL